MSELAPVFDDALTRVRPIDADAAKKAQAHQDQLTKPPGSLGRLEAAGAQLAAIARSSPPPVPEPAVVAVFAGDHGVLAQGVSPWPAEVTAQMVANFCAGGAAVNVLAAHAGAEVVVVDVGVAADVADAPGLLNRKVRRGTADLSIGVAMSIEDAQRALEVGAVVATDAVATGARCLLTGDMGIGNTTPSAALIAALTGQAARAVTGRGTGIDDDRWEAKVAVVERALARHSAHPGGSGDREDPLTLLASLGGLEIAALVGYMVTGAALGIPVMIDGVIAGSAALVATALVPDVSGYLVAGHRSSEPGAGIALGHLGLHPLLDLDLRLGEGTGACLALPILQAAAMVLRDMATFESAGVSDESAGVSNESAGVSDESAGVSDTR
ncbi:MAG TPA: nicotinate-nucleotide--dimethylbenzimidazole phosphoribosyltransferase [Acidimicrobiales bacterium]|nr:nicotinate-nucleotide--dimethylbenzimidazole phosphoribosyltransferase [Acidimicrobiales bacterium]